MCRFSKYTKSNEENTRLSSDTNTSIGKEKVKENSEETNNKEITKENDIAFLSNFIEIIYTYYSR